jgi:hypothetical protein
MEHHNLPCEETHRLGLWNLNPDVKRALDANLLRLFDIQKPAFRLPVSFSAD